MNFEITFGTNHGPLPAGEKPTLRRSEGPPPLSLSYVIRRTDGRTITTTEADVFSRLLTDGDIREITQSDRITQGRINQSIPIVKVEKEVELTYFVGGRVSGHLVSGFATNGKKVTRSADELGFNAEQRRRMGTSVAGVEYTVVLSPEIAEGGEEDPVIRVATKGDLDGLEERLGAKIDSLIDLVK